VVPGDARLVVRLERVGAANDVAHARALADLEPAWGSDVFPVGDGWAVLAGPGQFVNRVCAAGLTAPVPRSAIDELEARAAAVGVPPAFDLTHLTDADLVGELERRTYAADGSVTVLAMPLDRRATSEPTGVVVESVDSAGVPLWQELSAAGWGHATPQRRRANDSYAAAAAAAGQVLLVARDATDGRPIGCAVLIVRDGVATLGGMSTLPAERRRGVQTALVAQRLTLAVAAGCDVATTQAVTGGDSERNLMRLGFTPTHRKRTVARR